MLVLPLQQVLRVQREEGGQELDQQLQLEELVLSTSGTRLLSRKQQVIPHHYLFLHLDPLRPGHIKSQLLSAQ
jgi:hypothetical protein